MEGGGGGGRHMEMGMMPPSDTKMMGTMHMTFFWGRDVEVLFSGFPGNKGLPLYLLSLAFVFLMAFLVEALSAASHALQSSGLTPALARTALHSVRIGLAYLVMLAAMSFNGGVLLAAIAGHALGFFLFCSSAFGWTRAPADDVPSEKP